MANKLKIYYSIENGGDGSAYPMFFVDKDISEYHQDNLDEGWGEPCTGWITFEGDNLSCSEAQTKEGYYLQLLLDGYENEDEVKKFVSKFFPKGLPKFDVNILDESQYGILLTDKVIYKEYAHPGNTSEEGRWALKESIAKGEQIEV